MATKQEQAEFERQIDTLVKTLHITTLEAVVIHCYKTGLEIEVAATLVNDMMKQKLQEDAEDLNLLQKTARLPR